MARAVHGPADELILRILPARCSGAQQEITQLILREQKR